MTFIELIDKLSAFEEVEFWYNNTTYWFINERNDIGVSYWIFGSEEPRNWVTIGLFQEKGKLLNFPTIHKIWTKTIKQIFEEWLNY